MFLFENSIISPENKNRMPIYMIGRWKKRTLRLGLRVENKYTIAVYFLITFKQRLTSIRISGRIRLGSCRILREAHGGKHTGTTRPVYPLSKGKVFLVKCEVWIIVWVTCCKFRSPALLEPQYFPVKPFLFFRCIICTTAF